LDLRHCHNGLPDQEFSTILALAYWFFEMIFMKSHSPILIQLARSVMYYLIYVLHVEWMSKNTLHKICLEPKFPLEPKPTPYLEMLSASYDIEVSPIPLQFSFSLLAGLSPSSVSFAKFRASLFFSLLLGHAVAPLHHEPFFRLFGLFLFLWF
jgi:hypothetical protein